MKLLKSLTVITLLFCLFNSQSINAQETPREIGLRASGLDNLNFIYKKQLEDNKFLSFRAGTFNLNKNPDSSNFSAGFSLGLGIENRKPIDDKLSFAHGIAPFITTSYSSSRASDSFVTVLYAGYSLGFNLNVSKSCALNLSTTPALSSTITRNNGDTRVGLGLGFNVNAVSLSAAYRFNK